MLRLNKKLITIAVLFTILSLGLTWTTFPARALDKEVLQQGLRASVKLVLFDANDEVFGGCSGTILNNWGYILTNFHCVGHTDLYGPDDEFGLAHGELYHPQGILGVAITENPRQLPVPSYYAKYIAGNPDQDVAVIKIIADLDGNPTPETLPLIPAHLSDSDQVLLGEEVNIIGYPGVGGDTVTFTEGKIAGFLDDDKDGLTDWFKTDALINGGNSGGTAVNEEGLVVGIPSASMFDASRGDALRFIKPVNQAIPVIERAMAAGNSQVTLEGIPDHNGGSTIADGENIGSFTFGTGFRGSDVTGAGTAFPSGVAEVHAAVPYQNMRNGNPWGYIWLYEGQEVITEPNLDWNQGASGVLDLSIYSDEGLPDGEFQLQFLLDGQVVQEGGFVVGNANPIVTDEPGKPEEPQSDSIFVTGRIVDYNTGQPLADAMIVFLTPGTTVADFDAATDTSDMILSFGITGADGMYFSLLPLPRGQVYTVIAGHDGYQRLALDDALEVFPDDPAIVELEDIGLERY